MSMIFLSYKREDLPQIAPIAERLSDEGFKYWWDQEIPPGAPWEKTIEDNISICDLVVVFWSAQSVASENVKAEARFGRKRGALIQTFLDDTDPPLFFGERQGIDLSGNVGDASPGLSALIDHIREKITPKIRQQKESAESAPSGALTLDEVLSWLTQKDLQRLCDKLNVTPPNRRNKADMAGTISHSGISPEQVLLAMRRGVELELILNFLGKRSTGLHKTQMVKDILVEFD
jgi:hypothetical protein